MSNQTERRKETISFTPELRDSLRIAFNKAVEAKLDTFTWEGRSFVTSYAKYLLMHLDNQFGEAVG